MKCSIPKTIKGMFTQDQQTRESTSSHWILSSKRPWELSSLSKMCWFVPILPLVRPLLLSTLFLSVCETNQESSTLHRSRHFPIKSIESWRRIFMMWVLLLVMSPSINLPHVWSWPLKFSGTWSIGAVKSFGKSSGSSSTKSITWGTDKEVLFGKKPLFSCSMSSLFS